MSATTTQTKWTSALALLLMAATAAACDTPFSLRGGNRKLATCGGEMQVKCLTEGCALAPVRQMGCDELYELDFLYLGVSCSFSYFAAAGDDNNHECEDFNGGPQLTSEETTYINVTNLEETATFYSDYVEYGGFNIQDSLELPSKLKIQIYNEDQSLLLQRIVLDTSCDGKLQLADQIGSVQIMMAKDSEGEASLFSSDVPLQLVFPNAAGEGGEGVGHVMTLTSLKVVAGSASSVASAGGAQFWDLYDQVEFAESPPGADLEVQVGVPREHGEMALLITATVSSAKSRCGGSVCTYTKLFEFPALPANELQVPQETTNSVADPPVMPVSKSNPDLEGLP